MVERNIAAHLALGRDFASGALRAIGTGPLDKMRSKSHSRRPSEEWFDERVIKGRVICTVAGHGRPTRPEHAVAR